MRRLIELYLTDSLESLGFARPKRGQLFKIEKVSCISGLCYKNIEKLKEYAMQLGLNISPPNPCSPFSGCGTVHRRLDSVHTKLLVRSAGMFSKY